MNLSGISIILPTLNEGKNLKILIPELLDVFSDLNLKNSEIIVSDDGSTDDTKEILNQIDSNNYDVFFHKRSAKPSLPMSIYEGIEKSKNDYVMWLDADGSMPASMVKKMIEVSSNHTGYTHQWINKFALPYKGLFMASVDSFEEYLKASSLGFKCFYVKHESVKDPKNFIHCLASEEKGKKTDCNTCSLCSGNKVDVVINAHGNTKNNVLVGV